jgi:hypothetical protein
MAAASGLGRSRSSSPGLKLMSPPLALVKQSAGRDSDRALIGGWPKQSLSGNRRTDLL